MIKRTYLLNHFQNDYNSCVKSCVATLYSACKDLDKNVSRCFRLCGKNYILVILSLLCNIIVTIHNSFKVYPKIAACMIRISLSSWHKKYLTNEVAALTSQLALCTKRFDSRLVKIGCVSKRIFERWKSIFHPYLSEDCTPIRRSTLNVVTKPQRSDVGSPKVSLIFHNVQGKKNHKICSGFWVISLIFTDWPIDSL